MQIQFNKIPVDRDEVEVEQLVARTQGFSGAEVKALSLFFCYFDPESFHLGCVTVSKSCSFCTAKQIG